MGFDKIHGSMVDATTASANALRAILGVNNTDNTPDAAKPVSTAQAAADAGVQAFAIQRANHTGAQAISTVTGLQAALDSKGIGNALTSNPLSQFAATTSAQLRGVLSDETGNGAAYFQGGDIGTPSSGVATNLTYTPNGAGAVARTVVSKLNESVSVKDFLASGSGTEDTACSAAAAVTGDVVFPSGIYRITASSTWPAGKKYIFLPGASLAINTGVTLTIRGIVVAGFAQIFTTTGTGAVVGIRHTRPEWFGAVRNGTSDDAAAFNSAQTCMQAGGASDGLYWFDLTAGSYGIGSTVTASMLANYRPKWTGQGSTGATVLVGLSSFTGAEVLRVSTGGMNQSRDGCDFSGFRIIPQATGSGPSVGITIGDDTLNTLSAGPGESGRFSNVHVYDMAKCWRVRNARLFHFDRCGGWVQTLIGGRSLSLETTAPSDFTGDSDFVCCQFVANASSSIVCDMAASAGLVSGIRFNGSIFYAGSCSIIASSTGTIRDIWFSSGWQYDNVRDNGFIIGANGASSIISDISFQNGYVAGGLIGAFPMFNIFTISSGTISGIDIKDNYIVNTLGTVITGSGLKGLHVIGNRFTDPSGGACLSLNVSTNVLFLGNTVTRLGRTTTISYFVDIPYGGTNYYVVSNNLGMGLITASAVNHTPATNSAVSQNFI